MVIIAFDSHKRYTQACVERLDGVGICEERIEHRRGQIKEFLKQYEAGTPVAIETIGNWYWLVDEIESAGMEARLVHARKAKMMIGAVNKTDKLDARGLNLLQRCGTLPTVWIPAGELRDQRELPRTRMVFARQRTVLKNRIHSVIDKYGLGEEFSGISDIFGLKGKRRLLDAMKLMPQETRFCVEGLLEELEHIEDRLEAIENRIGEVYKENDEIKFLRTMPGVGPILSVVIWQEMGDVNRFASAERFASYCGTCPRISQSGDKCRIGRLRTDVNQYLKWAFSEAGNSIAVNYKRMPHRYVSGLYARLRQKKGHSKAVGAVARHLAESSWYMLSKGENYLERRFGNGSMRATLS